MEIVASEKQRKGAQIGPNGDRAMNEWGEEALWLTPWIWNITCGGG